MFGTRANFLFYNIVFCSILFARIGFVDALNGTINYYTLDSDILGFPREVEVYLPKDYNKNDTLYYPVIYFLHGFLGNHKSFGYIHEVIDDLIYSESAITPIIIIKPNGALNGTTIGSLWANSELNGRFEDYFFDEIMPWAETEFKIYNDSRRRMIMGHSFGASAAMRFIFERRYLFGSVSCHSGFVKMDSWLVQYYVNSSVINEFNHGVVTPTGPEKIFSLFVFTASKAWSPNPSEPYSIDLPMYNNGSAIIRPEIVAKWEAFSPHTILANNLAAIKANQPKMLYFDIGSRDELLLLQPNLDFASILLNDDLNYMMRVYDGPHNDPAQLHQRFRQSITAYSNYLVTLPVPVESSTSDSSTSDSSMNGEDTTGDSSSPLETGSRIQRNKQSAEESRAFPYGLVFGVIIGVIALAALVIGLTYFAITSRFHILFLEKRLTTEVDDSP